MPLEKVLSLKRPRHHDPMKPHMFFRALIRFLSIPSLMKTRFTYTGERLEEIKDKPCLILMNHSSFTDLKVAYSIFFPRPLSIVATTDGYLGKPWLMRLIGCIETQKFISDLQLIRDMSYALTKLKSSVLMFPEAVYSLDGRASVLPKHLGVIVKRLKVPVVTVTTYGAFARDPLYNGLQLRRVPVSAEVKCILTPEEIENLPLSELDERIESAFRFDQFAWQRDNNISIAEPFRADGLHRVLYHCPECGAVGKMEGKGVYLTCGACGKQHKLMDNGQLRALDGNTRFAHIPDWFDWQREQVRGEIERGGFTFDSEVDIGVLVDHKSLYKVGEGRFRFEDGKYVLTGCDGVLHYEQNITSSHSLNVDYFWYELGDMISIGDKNALYICFPKDGAVVTRARIAAEEIFRMKKGR
ncbi:MAG: 1-acyl-sn-glycerol-3-phosphate acyltransferase [Clostridia bacterium]|nr:1-acyl-sn-glycerol-3-phosphate acyltransferase [Clostridia bacterium]